MTTIKDWIRRVVEAGLQAAVAEIDRQGVTGHQREAAIRVAQEMVTARIFAELYKSATDREQARRRNGMKVSAEKRRDANRPRDAKIRADVARLTAALDGYDYDRKTLPQLLREFDWQGDADTFEASDINELVGKNQKRKLTGKRIGQILKARETS